VVEHEKKSEVMSPLDGERGKLYRAIRCSNARNCGEALLLAETDKAKPESLAGAEVRCPFCTRVTTVDHRRLFVREIR
jgi:hypothetical protein